MANNIDLAIDKAVLDLITKGTAVTVTTPVKLRLMATMGSNAANGTEITAGGGYTAGGQDTNTAQKWGTASGSSAGSVTTTADISWTNMPAATVAGVELWDSATTPKRLAQGALTASQTVAAGNTFTITAGQLTLSLT